MSWQPLAINWPASAAAIAVAATGVISDTAATLASTGGRLSGVTGATFTPNPQSAGAGNASSARAALLALLDGPCWVLSVDPWNAGSGDPLHKHLSPVNAANAIATKLRDSGDHRRPVGAVDAVCIMVYAASLPAFAQQLGMLNTVVPLLGFAQRRATQLSELETTKWIQTKDAGPLHWEKRQLTYQSTARVTETRLGSAVALMEAIGSENTNPIAELSAVIAQKTAAAAAANSALADLANQIGGGAGSGLFASGSSLSALAAILSSSAPADHSYSLAAGVCLVAPTGKLGFFKELFGL